MYLSRFSSRFNILLAILQSIKVDFREYISPLSGLSTISSLDNQRLVVNPYDSSV